MIVAGLVPAIMWGLNHNSGPVGGVAQAPDARGRAEGGTPLRNADVPIIATPEPTEAPITLPTNTSGEGDDGGTKPKRKSKPVPNLTPMVRDGGEQQALTRRAGQRNDARAANF